MSSYVNWWPCFLFISLTYLEKRTIIRIVNGVLDYPFSFDFFDFFLLKFYLFSILICIYNFSRFGPTLFFLCSFVKVYAFQFYHSIQVYRFCFFNNDNKNNNFNLSFFF
jgi:hypothetical protein